MDLIERQATIDAFIKYVADGYAESPDDFEGYMSIIRDMPSAQPEPQWIPCEDVLPHPGARVIVWARHTRLGVETSDILRYHGEKYGWENKDICTVIAWLPLPEPWRGEEYE